MSALVEESGRSRRAQFADLGLIPRLMKVQTFPRRATFGGAATALIGAIALSLSSMAAAQPSSVTKRLTVAPGISIRVVETGPKTAREPVIFIPGWSTGADIWAAQIKKFGADRRVLAFDPRSQGESTKVMSGNTPEQRAVDLHALIEKEGLKRPVLVGWSQAAQDVAAYVDRYGTHDLAGIVLVDAAVSDGANGIKARPEQTAAQFDRFAIYVTHQEDYLRGMFGAIVSKPQPAGVIDQAVHTGLKTPPSIGIAMLVADMFGTDRTAALKKIDCPVLIIAASNSGELERQQAEARVIKGAQFVKVEDSAHAVFLDQPDRFASILAQFLRTIDSL